MNKRGAGDVLMFFVLLALMVIVGVGVVIGVGSFFGREYSYNNVDAEILLSKIQNCLENNGFISNEFEFEEKCRLNKDVVGTHYLVIINSSLEEPLVIGNSDLRVSCFLKGLEGRDDSPYCLSKEVTLNGVSYEVFVGAQQKIRRLVL